MPPAKKHGGWPWRGSNRAGGGRLKCRAPHPVPLPLGEGTPSDGHGRHSFSHGERAGVRGASYVLSPRTKPRSSTIRTVHFRQDAQVLAIPGDIRPLEMRAILVWLQQYPARLAVGVPHPAIVRRRPPHLINARLLHVAAGIGAVHGARRCGLNALRRALPCEGAIQRQDPQNCNAQCSGRYFHVCSPRARRARIEATACCMYNACSPPRLRISVRKFRRYCANVTALRRVAWLRRRKPRSSQRFPATRSMRSLRERITPHPSPLPASSPWRACISAWSHPQGDPSRPLRRRPLSHWETG